MLAVGAFALTQGATGKHTCTTPTIIRSSPSIPSLPLRLRGGGRTKGKGGGVGAIGGGKKKGTGDGAEGKPQSFQTLLNDVQGVHNA